MEAAAEQADNQHRGSGRTEATRAALLDVATELFSTRGYVETSMRDIAREGPVSMGAIYLHFKNKADLLVEALERKIDEDLGDLDQPSDTWRDHVERLAAAA